MSEIRECKITGKKFEITDEDLAFYKKINVPPPTLCPEERNRRRIVWRNERHLYKRDCGLCGNSLISLYSAECEFPVYCDKCFWGDGWDPRSYGRDYDFERGFFEQFEELATVVPRLAMNRTKCVNSDYALNCIEDKNCYLTSGADFNEDCMYGINTQRSKFCVDHYLLYDSELTYGCLDSSRLYNCVGCQDSENCSDSWFLYDSKGCQYCAFSSNLRNQTYVFENKQLSKVEYEARLKDRLAVLYQDPDWMNSERDMVRRAAIHRDSVVVNCENVSGDYIRNSKDCLNCYDAEDCRDCKYLHYGMNMKDCYDTSCAGWGQVLYESVSNAHVYGGAFNFSVHTGSNVCYSIGIYASNNIFGSLSIRNHAENIILNKQYSSEEFETVRARVIESMGDEYGEFFPGRMAANEYNRSMAAYRMPLSREEALARGFRWYDGEEAEPSGAVSHACNCVECGHVYKIIKQEATFHEKRNIPLPKICWPCRMQKLVKSRRAKGLNQVGCAKCGTEVLTGEKSDVYCEKCYRAEVY